MKKLITAAWLISLLAFQAFACEHSAVARVTVYWHGEGSGANAAWNGARRSEGHCAVDPKKVPYGSKVVFHDTECLAVDTGSDVVNRKAARSCGRNAAERNAIVVDRFFDTKEGLFPRQRRIHISWWCEFAHPTSSPRTETRTGNNPKIIVAARWDIRDTLASWCKP